MTFEPSASQAQIDARQHAFDNQPDPATLVSREEIRAALLDRHTAATQDKLDAAHVAICGCGGLGSTIAVALTRIGVGHLHLIDFDRVDMTNLNRQQYFLKDLGQYKTEALRSNLRQINPFTDITIDTVEGMQFDKGYVSAYFVTDNDRMEAVMKDPYILITDQKISSVQDIMPVLEAVQRAGRGLLIIAEDIDGEALPTLVLNKIRGALNVCAVKAPGYGDRRKRILEDIAVLTGGQAALDELGVKVADITADMLGTAKSVTISKDNTVVVGGAGSKEAFDARIAQIKGEMENTTSDFDREKLQERLAKLSGGVAVIKVGAATESELKEIKHRVEDALQATRAAVEEGIVAGGGVAFMDAAPALDAVEIDDPEEKIGVDIVKKALTAPVATIAKNAGFEGAVVVDKVAELPAGQGLNSANGEWGDMIEMGVLDPVKVSRVTLQNAASVASLILITEATVSDVPKNTQLEDAIAAATAGQQGGGMY